VDWQERWAVVTEDIGCFRHYDDQATSLRHWL
jgi:hypothetical protein